MKQFGKLAALLLALCLAAALAGCSMIPKSLTGATPGDDSYESQTYHKEMGENIKTYFFDFSVDSVALADTYGDYTATEGMQLADVTLTVKNTFGETLPMYNSDFQIQWGPGDEDYAYGIEGLTDAEIMPEEFDLPKGESCTYHIVYEVPADAADGSLAYLEFFDNENVGDAYFVDFPFAA